MKLRWSLAFVVLASLVGTVQSCGSSTPTGSGAGGASAMGGTGGSGSGGQGGGACHAAGTLNVTNSGMTAYVIDGQSNPDLTFCRGSTYDFAINTPGHPFYINSVQGIGTANAFASGVTGDGTTSGTLTFAVPSDAPNTLYYDCSLHVAMTGTIHVVN